MSKKPTYEELEQRVQEYKQADEALKEENKFLLSLKEKYRTLFETMAQGVVYQNAEGAIMSANPAAQAILGLTLDQMQGRTSIDPRWKSIHEDGSDFPGDTHPAMVALETGKEVKNAIMGVLNPEEEDYRWIRINAVPQYKEGEDTPYQVYATFYDITESRLSEDALRESEERLKSFYDAAFEGIAITEKGKFIDVNGRFAELFGYEPDELIGSEVMNLVAEEDREFVLKNIRSGYAKPYEHKAAHKDGSNIFVEVHGKEIQFHGRQARVTVIHDITERRQAGEALRKAEERYRTLFEEAPAMYVITRHHKGEPHIVDCNALFLSSLGYSRDQVLNKPISDFYKPESVVKLREGGYRKARSGPFTEERQLVDRDGRIIETVLRAVSDEDGGDQETGTRAMFLDITNRKQAESKLRRYERIVAASNDHMAMIDRNYVYQAVNDAYLNSLNKAREDIIGHSVPEVFGQEFFEKNQKPNIARCLDGEVVRYQTWVNFPNSGRQYMDVAHFPYLEEDGSITGYVVNARDITEQKELEDKLIQAHKMEAIGTLAGGIAHDFNNILGIIVGNTELAIDDVPEWNPARHNLQEARKACLRARDVVKQILTFSRQSDQQFRPIRINPIIEDSLKLLRSSISTTIEIRHNISFESDIVRADATQINQVLINLCTNAAHAMRESGGILEVALKNIELDEDASALFQNLAPGKHLRLAVSDTGQGIDTEIVDRIFDPYFTTKEVGEGSGMGLAVVHGIVMKHKGDITVNSKMGKGATFHVFLPVIESEPESRTDTSSRLPKGDEHILVVDDEADMVDIIQPMLERLGYKVTAITSSVKALDVFQNEPDRFDLIITDMTMPDMTGDKLSNEIMKIRPDTPIILCTGFSEKIDEVTAKEMGINAFAMKPLMMSEIAVTIRNVLDTKPDNH
jgi:PAS domain S-box-containing protein